MDRRNTIAVVAVAAAGMIQGCSTMDRINAQDWSPYSGTKTASAASNPNAIDAASSAVADTVLLPFTATSYVLGYRYDSGTHTMRQSANNWGWSDYPPAWATAPTRGTGTPSGASSGTASTPSGAMGATGSTSTSTTTGTSGGTPAMGSTMSSGTSPAAGGGPATTMGTTDGGRTGAGTPATSSGSSTTGAGTQ